MNKKFKITLPLSILFVILIILDQITKYAVSTNLGDGREVKIFGDIFVLKYIVNFGAAFGFMQNQRIFFCILTIAIFVALVILYALIPYEKKYIALRANIVVLGAGAIGNLIDRLWLVSVRDFLYFKLIDFPIFNLADIYVTVSIAIIMLLVLFYYKDEDLEFLSIKRFKKDKTENAEKEKD
ncbi:MAG: signal peptidase II [Lachnospiraceae bacterium]|nr:signal peptidase II [Lachnospiraceae bacterium]